MKARIIRIGNSYAVRLPKRLIAEAGLSDEVESRARNGTIVVSHLVRPRAGWADAAKRAGALDEDRMLDDPTPSRFDDEEWK
jgi:antitoxin MazE